MAEVRRWLREWWITLRYGSPLTSTGRTLRRNMRDGDDCYIEVGRPAPVPRQTETTEG